MRDVCVHGTQKSRPQLEEREGSGGGHVGQEEGGAAGENFLYFKAATQSQQFEHSIARYRQLI